jgi:hypothetical protein
VYRIFGPRAFKGEFCLPPIRLFKSAFISLGCFSCPISAQRSPESFNHRLSVIKPGQGSRSYSPCKCVFCGHCFFSSRFSDDPSTLSFITSSAYTGTPSAYPRSSASSSHPICRHLLPASGHCRVPRSFMRILWLGELSGHPLIAHASNLSSLNTTFSHKHTLSKLQIAGLGIRWSDSVQICKVA